MAKVFDADEGREAFQPVTLRLRGQEYELGTDLVAVLQAAAAATADEDEGSIPDHRFATKVPELLPILAPDAPTDLGPGEQFVAMKALTALLNQLGARPFRTTADGDDKGRDPETGG